MVCKLVLTKNINRKLYCLFVVLATQSWRKKKSSSNCPSVRRAASASSSSLNASSSTVVSVVVSSNREGRHRTTDWRKRNALKDVMRRIDGLVQISKRSRFYCRGTMRTARGHDARWTTEVEIVWQRKNKRNAQWTHKLHESTCTGNETESPQSNQRNWANGK